VSATLWKADHTGFTSKDDGFTSKDDIESLLPLAQTSKMRPLPILPAKDVMILYGRTGSQIPFGILLIRQVAIAPLWAPSTPL